MRAIKPILFSTQMVQAILDGRKTMTRRVVNPQPPKGETLAPAFWIDDNGRFVEPKYTVGDILWVRETWKPIVALLGGCVEAGTGYRYKADDATAWNGEGTPPQENSVLGISFRTPDKWRPSIHMPKAAARIFLRVTSVRAERLQDITDDDAIAEGANFANGRNVGLEEKMRRTAIDRFRELWDSLNAKRGYGWDKNPWVWVVTFERISKQEAKEGGGGVTLEFSESQV